MSTWTPSDLTSWAMTEASIKEDKQVGAKFLVFLNFWLGTAEKMLDEAPEIRDPIVTEPEMTPANAVRSALEVAESRLGFIDVHFMGQLLVVIGTYWKYGDEAIKGFSIIELKLAGEALRLKLDEMNRQAEQDSDGTQGPAAVAGHDDGAARVDAAQEDIDPLDESDRPERHPGGPGSSGIAGGLGNAGPDSHQQAVQRSQAARRARDQRSRDGAGHGVD